MITSDKISSGSDQQTTKVSVPIQPSPQSRPTVPVGKRILWSTAFLITATLSATIGATVAMVSPLPSALKFFNVEDEIAAAGPSRTGESPAEDGAIPAMFEYKIERPVNILVMGIDRVPDTEVGSDEAFEGHTDTMILMRFDPTDQSVRMLSVPRDTQVFIPDVGTTKINDANVYGGAKLAMDVVGDTLNEVTIDRYVRVTNDAFRELVDLVGGIEVFVPRPMVYEDKTQGLKIDLRKGWQTLDGDEAEQFARFRMDEYGDIGRVQRQQVLLKAMRERLQSPAVLPRLPKVVQRMLSFVDTDLSMEELLALVNFGMELDQDSVKMVLLPGRFSEEFEFEGVSYWIMSHPGRDRVMQDFFEVEPGYEMGDRSIQSVRIGLQNATSDPTLLAQAADHLAEQGFGNVFYSQSKAPRLLRQSEIIVQQGNTEAADAIHEALGFGVIQADSTGDLASEITIRVGSDWFERVAPAEESTDEE